MLLPSTPITVEVLPFITDDVDVEVLLTVDEDEAPYLGSLRMTKSEQIIIAD